MALLMKTDDYSVVVTIASRLAAVGSGGARAHNRARARQE